MGRQGRVVDDDGELGELELVGEVRRLVAQAAGQFGGRRDQPGAVIDQAFAEAGGHHPLGQGLAHGEGERLTGRRENGVEARQTRRPFHAFDPGQVKDGAHQGAVFPPGEHHPVAIAPGGVCRVEAQHAGPQRRADLDQRAHRDFRHLRARAVQGGGSHPQHRTHSFRQSLLPFGLTRLGQRGGIGRRWGLAGEDVRQTGHQTSLWGVFAAKSAF